MALSIDDLFEDAHRRICIVKSSGRDLRRAWVGLQHPSGMKPMILRGWMQPISSEHPRILNWYTFTDAGWAEYERRFKDAPDYFDPMYQDFHQRRT